MEIALSFSFIESSFLKVRLCVDDYGGLGFATQIHVNQFSVFYLAATQYCFCVCVLSVVRDSAVAEREQKPYKTFFGGAIERIPDS